MVHPRIGDGMTRENGALNVCTIFSDDALELFPFILLHGILFAILVVYRSFIWIGYGITYFVVQVWFVMIEAYIEIEAVEIYCLIIAYTEG